MLVNSVQNIPFKFVCINCDYHSNKKSQYTRHLKTKKHILKNASRDASEKENMMPPQRDNDEKKKENTNKRQQSASPQANSNARAATKTLHRSNSNNKKQKQMRT